MLTVITPVANRSLTTVARVLEDMGPLPDVSSEILERRIRAASAVIRRHCDREFGRQTVRESFEWVRSAVRLSVRPAFSPTVTRDGVALEAAEFQADAYTGLIYRLNAEGAGVWWGGTAVVTYSAGWFLPGDAGYAAAPIDEQLPDDVEQACISLVTSLHSGAGRDALLRSETVEGVGRLDYVANTTMQAMPSQVMSLLAPYVRVYA